MVEQFAATCVRRLPLGGPGRDPYGNFVLSGIEMTANGQDIQFADAVANDFSGRPDAKQLFRRDDQVTANGWAIDATRDEKRLDRDIVFTFDKSLRFAEAFTLTIRVKQISKVIGQAIGRIRLSVTEAADPPFIAALAFLVRNLGKNEQRDHIVRQRPCKPKP